MTTHGIKRDKRTETLSESSADSQKSSEDIATLSKEVIELLQQNAKSKEKKKER